MLCALIMAGGNGERFWPLSTDEKPKQFLNLLGETTMIQMTVKRLEGLIPIERIFIATAKQYVNLIKKQIPFLPERNIVIEPIRRNTAPCIALSAFTINKYYSNSVIAVLPSDHLIKNEEEFRNKIISAYEFVESDCDDLIVTIGMKPDRPETGYGYIKIKGDGEERKYNTFNIYEVEKFVEKPNVETAEQYLAEGDFLWNGGIFVWKTNTILNLVRKFLNKTYMILDEIAATTDGAFTKKLEERYKDVENVSVDYGIMEKADKIYVIPVDIGWDDVGTWNAIERISEKDQGNNICIGDVRNINSINNMIITNSKPIVVVGVKNTFVIETDEMIFVGNKEEIENIKDIKDKISHLDI